MFADPQTVTVNAIAKSLVRTGTGIDTGSFATSDRAYRLTVSHDYKRRTRRVAKLQHDSLVASPLISGQNVNQSVAVHMVVDAPAGYDTTLLKQDVDGFVAWLAASSGAAVTKLLGGES
jgi:hypothetical protein